MGEARNCQKQCLTPGTTHASEGSSEKNTRPKFPNLTHPNYRKRHHFQLGTILLCSLWKVSVLAYRHTRSLKTGKRNCLPSLSSLISAQTRQEPETAVALWACQQRASPGFPTQPLNSCVILGKVINIAQFPQPKSVDSFHPVVKENKLVREESG